MDKARHILIIDSDCESPSNIAFLLKLAGYRITEFNDELEACNWLLQQDPESDVADLLLLNEPNAGRSFFALLFQIRQKFKRLELLLVAPEPLKLSGSIIELAPPVQQCCRGEIHNLTRQIFLQMEKTELKTQLPHSPAAGKAGSASTDYCSRKIEQEEP